LDWYAVKVLIEHATGFSMDALHVIVGVLVQLGCCILLRKPAAHPLPWLIVFAAELMNEYNDLRVETWPDPPMQYGEGLKDILSTMLLPTVILLLARYRSRVFAR
jgi:hypothetical protein